MARGHPDWGVTAATRTVAGVVDVGEAAVRLGSIDRFDRRGHVVFLEGFEDGRARWKDFSSGTGAGSALNGDRVRSGGYALKLTGGSAGDRRGAAYHFEAFPALSRFGMETAVAFEDGIERVLGQLDVYDGVTAWFFRWRYHHVNGVLAYYGPGDEWTAIKTGLDLFYDDYLFNVVKVRCDLATHRYVDLLLNDVVYSLAGLAPYSLASTETARLQMLVGAYAPIGSNPAAWFDDVIVTQNEP